MSGGELIDINAVVNGERVSATVGSRLLLSDFLRHGLWLTGTHVGCEHGVCGACNVLFDGAAMRSCLLLAVQADGHEVTTVEQVDARIRAAFVDHAALQCGFCTPGFLVALAELGDDRRGLDERQIREYLVGNLCRCTGYSPIVAAALDERW